MKNLLFTLAACLELTRISASSSSSSCGVSGYDKGTESFYGSSEDSYAACSAACLQYSSCNMFAVGGGECQLYDTTINNNWVSVSDSPYAAYDRTCISSTSTTKTGTTTSAKVTTTKSMTTTNAVKTTTTSTTSVKITTTATSAKTTLKSTASSAAQTSTTSAPSTQVSSSFICGEQGIFNKGSVSLTTYDTNYGEMTQEALTECYNNCQASYACFSWTWSPNQCQTMHSDTSHFTATTTNWYYVWDKQCPPPVVSDTTYKIATTTTTTQSTSSTSSSAKSTAVTTMKSATTFTTTTVSHTITTSSLKTTTGTGAATSLICGA